MFQRAQGTKSYLPHMMCGLYLIVYVYSIMFFNMSKLQAQSKFSWVRFDYNQTCNDYILIQVLASLSWPRHATYNFARLYQRFQIPLQMQTQIITTIFKFRISNLLPTCFNNDGVHKFFKSTKHKLMCQSLWTTMKDTYNMIVLHDD